MSRPDIQITEEMVRAGVNAFMQFGDPDNDPRLFVTDLFRAMLQARDQVGARTPECEE
jgi:hypothetical protein